MMKRAIVFLLLNFCFLAGLSAQGNIQVNAKIFSSPVPKSHLDPASFSDSTDFGTIDNMGTLPIRQYYKIINTSIIDDVTISEVFADGVDANFLSVSMVPPFTVISPLGEYIFYIDYLPTVPTHTLDATININSDAMNFPFFEFNVSAVTCLKPGIITDLNSSDVACETQNKTYIVSAVNGTLSYAWYLDGSPMVPSQNNFQLDLNNIQSSDFGTYQLHISNSCGTTLSSPMTLTSGGIIPSQLTGLNGTKSLCIGNSDYLEVDGLNYTTLKWYQDGIEVKSTTDPMDKTFNFTNATPAMSGRYTVEFIKSCSTVVGTGFIDVNVDICGLDPSLSANNEIKTYGDDPFYLNIQTESRGDFTYTIENPDNLYSDPGQVIDITTDGRIIIRNAGIALVKIVQAAEGIYNSDETFVEVTINKARPDVTLLNYGFSLTEQGSTLRLEVNNINNYNGTIEFYRRSGTAADVDIYGVVTLVNEGTIEVQLYLPPTANFLEYYLTQEITIYPNLLPPIANHDTLVVDTSVVEKFVTFKMNIVKNDEGRTGALDLTSIDMDVNKEGIQKYYTNGQGAFEVDDNGIVTYTILVPSDLASICYYTIKDENGSESAQGVIVFDINSVAKQELKAPDLITPNDDLINDVFVIGNVEDNIKYYLSIYDKFGNLVYENKEYKNDWSGLEITSNKKISEGDYYYLVKEEIEKEPRSLKGIVKVKY